MNTASSLQEKGVQRKEMKRLSEKNKKLNSVATEVEEKQHKRTSKRNKPGGRLGVETIIPTIVITITKMTPKTDNPFNVV